MRSVFAPLALLPLLAFAKTDIAGCTSSQTVAFGGASVIWYVPGTGEICKALDCGGGRAPPKYSVPGCAAYTGTAAYTPEYLEGWGPNGQIAPSTTAAQGAIETSVVKPTGDSSGVEASSVVEVPSATGATDTLITEAPATTFFTEPTHVVPSPTASPPSFTGGASTVGKSVAGIALGAVAALALL